MNLNVCVQCMYQHIYMTTTCKFCIQSHHWRFGHIKQSLLCRYMHRVVKTNNASLKFMANIQNIIIFMILLLYVCTYTEYNKKKKRKEIKKKSNKHRYVPARGAHSNNSETGDIAATVACIYRRWSDGKTHQHNNLIEQNHMGFCFNFSTHFRTCLPMCRRSKPKRIHSQYSAWYRLPCRVYVYS